MALIATVEEAPPSRGGAPLPGGGYISARAMIGDFSAPHEDPHAFLVEQTPNGTVGAHFHFNRQFQVVVRGSGTLGRHPVEVGSVHYAAAETGYGPIVAGDEGLAYLTLRQVTEGGIHYLPESANLMHHGLKRRQTTSEPPHRGEGIGCLIPADETHLAAWTVELAPGQVLEPPPHDEPCDRYHVVIRGAASAPGRALAQASVLWTGAGEALPEVTAGPEGAQVLVLQFPKRD
jgi:hypothetical protein